MKAFEADMARFDKMFADANAIMTTDDGFAYIDQSKFPADIIDTYWNLVSYGYANGLLP